LLPPPIFTGWRHLGEATGQFRSSAEANAAAGGTIKQ